MQHAPREHGDHDGEGEHDEQVAPRVARSRLRLALLEHVAHAVGLLQPRERLVRVRVRVRFRVRSV